MTNEELAVPLTRSDLANLLDAIRDCPSARREVRRLAFERDALKARVAELERGCAAMSAEVSQVLGKALGYPWYKDDQENFPGATEANGVCTGEHVAETIAAEAAKKLTVLKARVAELEAVLREAGRVLLQFECYQIATRIANLLATTPEARE